MLALRARQQRNFLATLLLSQGVPMLLGGDELGRTQGGNNNGYCQDNEISWFDWDDVDEDLLDFARWLIALRAEHPVFRRRRWFQGHAIRGADVRDIAWLTPDGTAMGDDDWEAGASALQVFLNGEGILTPHYHGEPVVDDSFLLLFNPTDEDVEVTLPDGDLARRLAAALRHGRGPAPTRARGRGGDGRHAPDRGRPLDRDHDGRGGRMTPASTYRLQVRPGFDLDAAAEVADYLARLGVSHVYTSPLLAAEPGSRPRLRRGRPDGGRPRPGRRGGVPAAWWHGCASSDLGLVVDIVPNHVAVLTAANPSWWDVLRRGPDSPRGHALRHRLARRGRRGTRRRPRPGRPPRRGPRRDRARHPRRPSRRSPTTSTASRSAPARSRRPASTPADGTPDRDTLRALLGRQHHDLRFWRDGVAELNYRRFFDVTSLGGVRIEDPEVADWVLGRSLRMVTDGDADGLRVDHPDGMRDPAGRSCGSARTHPTPGW